MLLRIGDLARVVGLSPDTIRHYERLGLLTPQARTAGGFREYRADAVRRVRTVQAALEIGFSLRELAGLFRARAAGRPPCREARRLAGAKLQALNDELTRLMALRTQLESVIERWDEQLARAEPGSAALLLESLAETSAPGNPAREANSRRQRRKNKEASCSTPSNASRRRSSSSSFQRSLQRAAATRTPSTEAPPARRTRGR